jgi:predicted nucleic acid-binding protein
MGMSRIFWDSNLFIYLLESNGPHFELVNNLSKTMSSRGDQLFTSTLTLGEVLVKPFERHNEELAKKYVDAITKSSITIDFDIRAARIYARLRGNRSLRPPDAIQLACAASVGVDLFVTNDARLHSIKVDGIQFIVPLERAPL